MRARLARMQQRNTRWLATKINQCHSARTHIKLVTCDYIIELSSLKNMAELDKKIQKTQTDLVQAVLEAQEKKNQERVDMLITNAIKQLKMSRFKPDQSACLSLIYLARTNPKVFSSSNAIKEVLKSLVRRDSGPTNIKGKNDIMLPVLAANILLACSNVSEIRQIVLNKVDQWLSANQKISEIVLHLLATTCMKCHNDQQTIQMLIDLRQHWLQYLDDNFDTYGPVPSSLCVCVRKLLLTESRSDSLLELANFLIKHDSDIVRLAEAVSQLIIERPITLEDMITKSPDGSQLQLVLLRIFDKLFAQLKAGKPTIQSASHSQAVPTPVQHSGVEADVASASKEHIVTPSCNVKQETKPILIKIEPSTEVEATFTPVKPEIIKSDPVKSENDMSVDPPLATVLAKPMAYIKLSSYSKVIAVEKLTIEALLTFIATFGVDQDFQEQLLDIPNCWLRESSLNNNLSQPEIVRIFEDMSQTTPYLVKNKLRQALIYSENSNLVELALETSTIDELLDLLHLFDLTTETIDKILARILSTKDNDKIKLAIKDRVYFNDLIGHFVEIGTENAKQLADRIPVIVQP